MANRVTVSKPFRARVNRKTSWVASVDSTAVTILAANSSVLDQSFDVSAEDQVGATVVRTRGMLTCESDQVAASEDQLLGLGMGVVSKPAVTAGTASVPTPFVEEPWDGWFVYEVIANSFVFGTGVGFQGGGLTTKYFDSKAMRKLGDLDMIAIVLENGSTVGLQYWLKFRILLKLP